MIRDFYTAAEAAQSLGISRDRVYEYLRSGHIRSVRIGPHSPYQIPPSEIGRLKDTAPEEKGKRELVGLEGQMPGGVWVRWAPGDPGSEVWANMTKHISAVYE